MKQTKTSLKKKANNLVSKIVRLKGKCERCGKSGDQVQLQCAHIVGRSNHTLRFDLMNVLCLGSACHRWAHNYPIDFTRWVKQNYPNRVIYLDHNKNFITRRTLNDYKELVEALKKLLKEKQNELR